MKGIKICFLFILAFLMAVATRGPATAEEYPLFTQRYHFQRQLELTLSPEWKDFISQHGAMYRVRWNELTSTPTSIIGPGIDLGGQVSKSTVEDLTLSFIGENQPLLKADPSQLELLRADQVNGGWEVVYQQLYQGLPVFSGSVRLSITPEDKVILFGSDFYVGIDLSTSPTISQEEADSIAKEELGFNPETDSLAREAELTVLPDVDSDTLFHHLAYKVELLIANPLGDWICFVDAHSGEPIYSYNQMVFPASLPPDSTLGLSLPMRSAQTHHPSSRGRALGAKSSTISGVVKGHFFDDPAGLWNPHTYPYPNELVVVSSESLGFSDTTYTDGDGYFSLDVPSPGTYLVESELRGYDWDEGQGRNVEYIDVNNFDTTDAYYSDYASTGSPLNITWDWGEPKGKGVQEPEAYGECNVYYHVTKLYRYITGPPFECDTMLYPVTAWVNYWAGGFERPAYYRPSSEWICFVPPWPDRLMNPSMSSDMIYWAYTRAIIHKICDLSFTHTEQQAIHIGVTDYFSCSLGDDPEWGENVGIGWVNDLILRNLSNQLRYENFDSSDANYSSQILSGAMWDLRGMLGEPLNTDWLIYKTTYGIPPNAHFSFTDFLNRLLMTDDDNNNPADGTPHIEQIYRAFYLNHGIGPGKYLQPGGHITQNTLWGPYDSLFVFGDVTVDPGVTLTIGKGSSIYFWPNHDEQKSGVDTSRCELIVEGELVVSGVGADSVVLGSPVSGGWYGVRFKPGGQGQIWGAIVKNGYCGVFMDTASVVTIEGSSIRGNQVYGVYARACSPSIIGNSFPYPNQDCAIKVVGDSPDWEMVIRDNTILMPVLECDPPRGGDSTGATGIYIEDATAQIEDNQIVGGHYGIIGVGLDSATLIKGSEELSQKLDRNCIGLALYSGSRPTVSGNQISDYGDIGVACYESYPLLGDSLIPGTGYNSIILGSCSPRYAVYCEGVTDTIKAENNFWGQAPPDPSWFWGPVDYDPWLTSVGVGPTPKPPLPDHFSLAQNYPNPFNPTTVIRYSLPVEGYQPSTVGGSRATSTIDVSLKVYNVLGQVVRTLVDEPQAPGYYRVRWDGRDSAGRELASGIYIYRIQAGDFSQSRRMVLLK